MGKYFKKGKVFKYRLAYNCFSECLTPFLLPQQIYFPKSFSSKEGKCYRYSCQHISICECWCEYLCLNQNMGELPVAWESFGQEADGSVAAVSTWWELLRPLRNAAWAMLMISTEYVVQSGGVVCLYKWAFQYPCICKFDCFLTSVIPLICKGSHVFWIFSQVPFRSDAAM